MIAANADKHSFQFTDKVKSKNKNNFWKFSFATKMGSCKSSIFCTLGDNYGPGSMFGPTESLKI